MISATRNTANSFPVLLLLTFQPLSRTSMTVASTVLHPTRTLT